MKQQTSRQPTDEREKMRRFRELDDAFSEALRQLDDPNNDFDIPTGPPVRSIATLEREERQGQQQDQQRLQETQQQLQQDQQQLLEKQQQARQQKEQQEEQQRQEAREKARQLEFERRLYELMADYALSAQCVSRLLTSLSSREGVE